MRIGKRAPLMWLAWTLKLHLGRRASVAFLLCVATAMALPGQTFTTLAVFADVPGAHCDHNGYCSPYAGLVQGTDGNYYGTTSGQSSVFQISPEGVLTTVYGFKGAPGVPDVYGGVIQATNGDFYGTTLRGGVQQDGSVFSVSANGALRTLHVFGGADGAAPFAGLVQGTDGNFYGTTSQGGPNVCPSTGTTCGTVFKITPGGKLTTLHVFDGSDGDYPVAGLVQGVDGDFYGAASGTIFKITSGGTFTALNSLTGGASAALVQGTDGNFYGITAGGGDNSAGTIFEITPTGVLTTLYSFCPQSGCPDGQSPQASLVQGTDGNFYGTTAYGGNPLCDSGCGTIYRFTTAGVLTTLHSFDRADGFDCFAPVVQRTDGNFYGTTWAGGGTSLISGTAYNLSVGLGAFVKTQTASGKVGARVTILGTALTGATSVTFNGTQAAFTVNSTGTAISTTVPASATTGEVQVVTPSGTLASSMQFRVR